MKKLKDTKPNDIIYCQANSNYTFVYYADGQRQLVCKTLSIVHEVLGLDLFVRTHSTYVVNKSLVESYNKKSRLVRLTNGLEFPISRSRKVEIDELLKG